jgi:hypothetical protein
MSRDNVSRRLTPSDSTLDESYWLNRARVTYSKAAMARDPALRKRLQRVAFGYERLAGFAMRDDGCRPSSSRSTASAAA